MRHSLIIAFLLYSLIAFADNNIGIGQWRSHQNFSQGFKVARLGDTVYCATANGLFYYNRNTHVSTPLSKINGFSDVNLRAMGCNQKYHQIYLGYQNANIDILQNGKILNVKDINTYGRIAGAKFINGFFFNNQYCYVATSFGIVQYDIEKNEIYDDYQEIWPLDAGTVNVNSIAFFNDSIYAATSRGLIGAPLNKNVNLRDYTQWKLIFEKTDCKSLCVFNNKLWLGINSITNPLRYFDKNTWLTYNSDTALHKVLSLETNDKYLIAGGYTFFIQIDSNLNFKYRKERAENAIVDENNDLWIANAMFGLLRQYPNRDLDFIKPNGPYTRDNAAIYSVKNTVYVAHGGFDQIHYSPLYHQTGVSYFSDGVWYIQNKDNGAWFGDSKDINSISSDPITGNIYYSSYGYGLSVFNSKNNLTDTFGAYNSPFKGPLGFDSLPPSKVVGAMELGGISFDDNGTLWITNFLAKTPLIARKNNKFIRYDVTSIQNKKDFISVTPDNNGKLWLRRAFNGGIIIFDPKNNTSVEKTTKQGEGNLPDNIVTCIVRDKNDDMWVGTNNGVIYFNTDPSSKDGTRPWVENGKESGNLLSLQTINCIAVDGANRKWIGTKKGLFVTSADGQQILYNFTIKNSPIPSDNIQSIGINGESGEVFIGTDAGIMSYRANATEASDDFTDVYAFPNPVRPGYTGPIAIKGLTDKTSIKITDITGNLVWETTSQGGLVTWDGKNFSGELASSGVYLVLMANEDGSKTHITKILIVR